MRKALVGSLIKIRSDLSICEQLPAIQIDVKLPHPLTQIWSELRKEDVMPYFSTKSVAGIAMLKEVRAILLDSPKMRNTHQLLEIARPISLKTTQLRPSLSKEFDSQLSIESSILMSFISFLGSKVLQMLFVCIYHCYKHKHRETNFWCGLFCPKKSLFPGREENIIRTVSLSTLADARETTSDIELNTKGHGMKRTASEIIKVSSGCNKFPTVNQIQCPSYDTVQQERVIYSFTSKRLLGLLKRVS